MTYPVDDAGNPRVDFVWGHLPMQPDQDRQGRNLNRARVNQDQNASWTNSLAVGSDDLHSDWSIVAFPTGDGGNGRQQTFTWGDHDIATTGYSNFPAFIPNYAGDGDTALELIMPDLSKTPYAGWAWQGIINGLGLVWQTNGGQYQGATAANEDKLISQTPAAGAVVNVGDNVVTLRYVRPEVPNLVGLSSPTAAQDALTAVGLVLGDSNNTTVGADSGNDLHVKTQSIAAGTKVDGGSAVDIVTYHYVAPPSVNYSIAGIRSVVGQSQQRYLYLHGRNSGLVVMDQITLHDTGVANYERPFNVLSVVDDDTFNTGGQKVLITNGIMDGSPNDVTNTGYYTKP